MSTPENDQLDEVRSDLWGTMDVKQLDQQRILISKRMSAIRSVMSNGMVNPTTIGLNAALEHAMHTVNQLLTKKLT
jgi:hypothetical protein